MTRAEIEKLSDSELILHFQSGCDYAYDCLYERHYQHVYRYLRNLTMNKETARDLTQDLFLKVLISFKNNKFIGTNFFAQYLRGNCYYIFIDNKRKFKENVSEADFDFNDLVSDTENIESIMINSDKTNYRLNSLICKLPKRNQDILHLHIYQGKAYEDIALNLKISTKNVESNFKSSLRELKNSAKNEYIKYAI